MKNYKLAPDEVILYKGNVLLQEHKNNIIPAELILTNLNFIFISEGKKILFKQRQNIDCFAKEAVKTYKDTPQIKQKGDTVEIYFLKGERTIRFENKHEAYKFTFKALSLITGKTAFARNVEKVKKTVENIDETLGFNATELAQAAIQVAIEKKPASKVLSAVSYLLPQKEQEPNPQSQLPEQSQASDADTLRELKALLDEGVITKAEFNAKKKELLNL